MYNSDCLKAFINNIDIKQVKCADDSLADILYLDESCYATSHSFNDDTENTTYNRIIIKDPSMTIALNALQTLFKYNEKEAYTVLDSLKYLASLFDAETYMPDCGFLLAYQPESDIILFQLSDSFYINRTVVSNYLKCSNNDEKILDVRDIKNLGINFIRNHAMGFYGISTISDHLLNSYAGYTTKDIIEYYGNASGFNYLGLKETQLFFKSKGINPLSCSLIEFDRSNIHILKEYFSLILCKNEFEEIDNLINHMFWTLKTLNKKEIISFSLVSNLKTSLKTAPIECYYLNYDVHFVCIGYDLNYVKPYNHVSIDKLNIYYSTHVGVYSSNLKDLIMIEQDMLDMRVAHTLGKKTSDVVEIDYDLYSMITY